MAGSNGTTWGDITMFEEMAIEALKRGCRGAKGKGEENIISAVIHVDETTPHLCQDCAVDQVRESIGERRDRRQKKMLGRKIS